MIENTGHIHPITRVTREVKDIFFKLGFGLASGPEAETEYYNFDALNIPADHPARDMWDTFWIKSKGKDPVPTGRQEKSKLLRTHTSPVQVRYAEGHKPPFRIIVPGKTYRHEATDATHEAIFHQVEGLVVDKGVTLTHLKWTLEKFFKEFFGPDSKVRLRPSYFPFTEPSVEVDAWYPEEKRWLEVMGAGLVHPKVIRNFGLDPEEWSGFAFGGGLERLAILKYGIPDIRMFSNGDLRLVNQF